MTDGYLSRAEVDHLADQLAKLPGLEVELAVAVTGTRRSSVPTRRAVPRSKPPYSIETQCLIDDLRSTLWAAISDLCEQRDLQFDGSGSITGMGKWLHAQRFGLQLIESGVESFNDLCRMIDRCERALSFGEQEYRIPKDREDEMVQRANRLEVDAAAVDRLARKLGEQAKGLNRARVDYLRRHEYLVGHREIDEETGEEVGKWWYYLGDVLKAHKEAREYRASKA
ncbi:helix-turn-helix DNA binding domain protein [Gordonia phage Budski]|nr:helix-turn-helix DNA binding domain protein [Gordonia phage Budski]